MRLFNPGSEGDAPLQRRRSRILTGHLFLKAKNRGGSLRLALIGKETKVGSSSTKALTLSNRFRLKAVSISLEQGGGGGDKFAEALPTRRGVEGGDKGSDTRRTPRGVDGGVSNTSITGGIFLGVNWVSAHSPSP
jgi:hypothetical protein